MVSRADLGIDGNRLPVNIQMTYNANDRVTDIGYGRGWRMNYSQKIVAKTIGGSQYYLWTDEDGTQHVFKQETVDGSTIWADEAGRGYELTLDVSSTVKYRLTDTGDNQLDFDTGGRLVRIQDGQNAANHIDIEYVPSANNTLRINRITDGAGRVYEMAYEGYDGMRLTGITYTGTNGGLAADQQRSVSYAYTTRTIADKTAYMLTAVTYPDGKQAQYAYHDGQHMMTWAQDIDGYGINYTYQPVPDGVTYVPPRVQGVAQKKGDTPYNSAAIAYGKLYTKVTDQTGAYNVFHFNAYGNMIFVQDDAGRAQYYAYSQDLSGGGRANELRMESKLQDTVINMARNPSFEGEGSWAEINAAAGRSWAYSTTERERQPFRSH